MQPIQWSRWMSVGIDALDEDHRTLVAIVNKLADEGNRRDPSIVESILDELIDYTKRHFAAEEAEMRERAYPTYPAHKALHDSLTEQVESYRRRFQLERGSIAGEEVFEFCAGWLSKHILREDTRFGEYAAKPAPARA